MANRTSRLLLTMVVMLVLATLLLAWAVWQQYRREQSSSELAVTVTQSVLTSNSAAALIDNAHPDLLARSGSSELDAYLAYVVRRLGQLQSLEAISGGSQGGWLPGFGEPASASYTINLQFAAQPATAELDLQQLGGAWLIREFMIAAPALNQ